MGSRCTASTFTITNCYRHKLTWAESKMGLKQKIEEGFKSAPA